MIEVKGVSKFYSQKKALDEVSLNIEAGRIFGLIGPNGAG
jgi:ABC-2 type transport system ATP-binding protein